MEIHDLCGHLDQGPSTPKAQVRRHLVVAAPPGVQLGPHVAGEFGDPTLHRGVNIFVAFGKDKGPRHELTFDLIERVEQCRHLVLVQDPSLAEPLDVGFRPDQVVVREDLIEGRLW